LTPTAIGAALHRWRAELHACGADLDTLLDPQARQGLRDIGSVLAKLSCKIAVIGQIKAGKSSFINALIRQPDLLPTHVNPWTTAVTSVHFASPSAPAGVGASFTFFDRDEWHDIAVGGGKLRELTTRLVPGFEEELLRHHLDEMRRRTHLRLGGALDELLGQTHTFAAPSRELLERYVSAGSDGNPTDIVFSDVVKRADLYFEADQPAFPVTLIDTPGTNDPFIVRDEISRRALESADLYVVVLTARDPLSSADLALLRILRGLYKEKIVLFVDRIDEWDDIAGTVQPVRAQIQARLATEFPGVDVPIVVGSAHWALAAMAERDPAFAPAAAARIMTYARHLGVETGAMEGKEPGRGVTRSTLLACSGLPDLHRVLGRLVLSSHAGHVLRQVTRSYAELTRFTLGTLRRDIARASADELSLEHRYNDGQEELRRIYAEVDESQRLTSAVHALLIDFQARTQQIVESHAEAVEAAVVEAVAEASRYECAKLQRALVDRGRRHIWVADTDAIRRYVGDAFLQAYAEADEEFSAVENYVLPKLRDAVAAHIDVGPFAIPSALPGPVSWPALTALAGAISLDLEEPWWRRWWSTRSADTWLDELHTLIVTEFRPIAAALGSSARRRLETRRTEALQTATAIFVGLVEASQSRSEARLARMEQLVAERDAITRGALNAELVERSNGLRRQLQGLEVVAKRLEDLETTWSEQAVGATVSPRPPAPLRTTAAE
jgi:signal recognition particle receptor subunit beta/uncharacterized coiled-coil protein SlyX